MTYNGDMHLGSRYRELRRGVYQHYKGNRYRVLHVAQHSETSEQLVVYQELYGGHGVWVRPLEKFQEKVIRNGQCAPRFTLIEPEAEIEGETHGFNTSATH